MMHQMTYESGLLQFDVIRSGRRKTSEITIEPTGIVVRVPSGKNIEDIERLVARKAKWIAAKQLEMSKVTSEVARPTFEDGSRLPYLGKMIPLRIVGGPEKFRLIKGEFVVTAKGPDSEVVRRLYEDWLTQRARKVLPPIIERYSNITGTGARKVIIKKMRKRWGSATKNNTLNLNVNLLKAPEDVVDYVVLHELCHLKERNHSHRFWALVSQFMPDHKKREAWLGTNAIGIVEE